MARGKELSNSQKALIVKLWKDGESYRNISSNLNISFTTISSFIARFKRHNTVENEKITGTPRKISLRLSRKLGRLINQNSMVASEKLQEDLRSSGSSVTKRTVSNEMLRNGLKSRRLKKIPLLLKRHRDSRLKFVRQHKEKENSFWEKVLWTVETKIELFGHNYRNHVWRKDGEAYSPKNTVPTVNFGGGSIMNWGYFSAKRVGKISVIDGKMNTQKYTQILQENLMSSIESFELPFDYIFQQDNDPKNTAKSTKKWLSENNVNVLQWPSESPNLNPIGNFWWFLKIQIRKREPANINNLKTICQEEWYKIPTNHCKKLTENYRKRLVAE